jgi:hypothetical protein
VKPPGEQRFRFRNYSPKRLESARWHLFEFDEVRDVTHLAGDIVVVRYEGEPPQIKEWTALLEERGFVFEPILRATGDLDAA